MKNIDSLPISKDYRAKWNKIYENYLLTIKTKIICHTILSQHSSLKWYKYFPENILTQFKIICQKLIIVI